MSRIFDLLQGYASAMQRGDTALAISTLSDLLWEYSVPPECNSDIIFLSSWAYSSGLAEGLRLAREAITAHHAALRGGPAAGPLCGYYSEDSVSGAEFCPHGSCRRIIQDAQVTWDFDPIAFPAFPASTPEARIWRDLHRQ